MRRIHGMLAGVHEATPNYTCAYTTADVHETISHAEVKRWLVRLDPDGSGYIDTTEFVDAMLRYITRNTMEAMVCRWKVSSYKHPPPDRYMATPQQMESFTRFLAWQGAISEQLLKQSAWVFSLTLMAVANAEK